MAIVLSFSLFTIAASQSANIEMVLDASPLCAAGRDVVARHPRCNSTPVPRFPAKVMGIHHLDGTLQLVYGYSSQPPANWTDVTSVPATSIQYYSCRDSSPGGWKKGEPGRGFKYLPDGKGCNITNCAVGCRIQPPSGCVQGERFKFGEVCTARCDQTGYLPSRVNITCDLKMAARLRTVQCRPSSVGVCGNGSTNSSTTSCAPGGSSTLTTTQASVNRHLKGCAELKVLRPGTLNSNPSSPPLYVGMPNVLVESGGVYFEVKLEGPSEQVGWVDKGWGRIGSKDTDHQWLSPIGGPGIVSVTLKVIAVGIADIWFSRDGSTPTKVGMTFEPPTLTPVAFLHGKATWVIPYASWTYLPPVGGQILPFTQHAFPAACTYPPTYVMFSNPARCGAGFRQLNSTQACQSAAFTMGLTDLTTRAGSFPGYPDGCFECQACDLDGNLYLNAAQNLHNTTQSLMQLAPLASKICIRSDSQFTSTTTVKTSHLFTITTFLPPLYKRGGTVGCTGGFVQIFHSGHCSVAAAWLGIFDTTVKKVSLNSSAGSGQTSWPMGCFHCLICDAGSLFFNGPDQAIAANASSPNKIRRIHALEDFHGVDPQLRRTSGRSLNTSSSFVVEVLCRNPTVQTTSLGSGTSTTRSPVSITTTFVGVSQSTSTAHSQVISATTSHAPNTMGILTCSNPYGREKEVPWWENPVLLGGGAGGLLLCCCGCCCCFIKGGFSKCRRAARRCLCENRCMKRCKCCGGRCSRTKKEQAAIEDLTAEEEIDKQDPKVDTQDSKVDKQDSKVDTGHKQHQSHQTTWRERKEARDAAEQQAKHHGHHHHHHAKHHGTHPDGDEQPLKKKQASIASVPDVAYVDDQEAQPDEGTTLKSQEPGEVHTKQASKKTSLPPVPANTAGPTSP